MHSFKRLTGSILNRSLLQVKDLVSTNKSILSRKTSNLYLKSKLLLGIAFVILISMSVLLSHHMVIFHINTYGTFVKESEVLHYYIKLNKIFRSKEFLYQFKYIPERYSSSSVAKLYSDEYESIFNYNHSNAAYLNHVLRVYETEKNPSGYLKSHKLDFHWADWSDVSWALPLINSYDRILHSNKFNGNKRKFNDFLHTLCYDKLLNRESTANTDESQLLTTYEQVHSVGIFSAIVKYYEWPNPERIFFETDYEYFELFVNEKKPSKPLGIEGLSKIYYGQDRVSSNEIDGFVNGYDRQESINNLISVAKEKSHISGEVISLRNDVTLSVDDFKKPDAEALLKEYRAIADPTDEQKKYLNFLESNKLNEGIQKLYFNVPMLKTDPQGSLHHYGIPFFKHILSHEERIKNVHHLLRSWFKFSEQADIISWFSYGNLIGWYFNSMNLPWDNDADVQISIKGLQKLSQHYNNTLVVEDPNLGDSTFYLHVNPYHLQTNREQYIDARYIDIKSGIYIDISALYIDNSEAPSTIGPAKEGDANLHCQALNWFRYNDIFPLRRTLYEGAQAYTVNRYETIMRNIYGDHPFTQKVESNYNWQPDLGIWVRDEVCDANAVPKTRFDYIQDQLTLEGACNDTELLELWRNTKQSWKHHQREFELLKEGKDTSDLTEKSLPVYRTFDYDPFR